VAIHGRFAGLMGDFKDVKIKTLSLEQKNELIESCMKLIRLTVEQYTGIITLVLADSQIFLDLVCKIPGVEIIKGTIIHTDHAQNTENDTHIKTFVDFILLSEAEQIYQLNVSPMYKSAWPLYAQRIKDSGVIKYLS
jgi:hypothetical protein